jgi:molybdopterin/thiamine biosynthesis adenylyltransferase/ubiquitin-protein ligase
MSWWETREHILVREYRRLNESFPDNDFIFFVKEDKLWLSGTLKIPEGTSPLLDFQFELSYPENYPFSLPYLFPKGREKNWVSSHQYTTSEFCLDIRKNSWNSSLTAVDLLKSLVKLLSAKVDSIINNRTKLEISEEEEPSKFDLVTKGIGLICPVSFNFSDADKFGDFNFFDPTPFLDSRRIAFVPYSKEIGVNKYIESEWIKIWGMNVLRGKKGLWLEVSPENLNHIVFEEKSSSLIKYIISENILSEEYLTNLLSNKEVEFLLFLDKRIAKLFCKLNIKDDKLEFSGCYTLDFDALYSRIPNNHELEYLSQKKVAIVGVGSVGSLIAEELIKSGLTRLLLIDDDYLTTENVFRHSCGLSDVGMKKTTSLRIKLQNINPKIEVEEIDSKINIISNLIDEKLKKVDLVINAAADAEEIINEFCWQNKIPSLYIKIYPEGFGGEVFRVIPNITPCFECTSVQFSNFVESYPKVSEFPQNELINYNETLEGVIKYIPSLSIDIKFVSLICVKMGLDLLKSKALQDFIEQPNIILWGNRRGWIFTQDLECLKIKTSEFKSLNDCIVCFGNKQIENELKMSSEEINEFFKSIKIRDERD